MEKRGEKRKNYLWLSILLLLMLLIGIALGWAIGHFHSHQYGQWQTVKAETCTQNGRMERVCSCGDRQTQEIPACGHDMVAEEDIPATCTESGKQGGAHCARCDYTEAATVVPALGHDFVDYHSNQDATCTQDGTKTAKCSRCEAMDTCPDVDSATGHTWEKKVLTSASCETAGIQEFSCRCGESYTETIRPKGHDYVDGVCRHCGKNLAADDLLFKQNPDGAGYCITGIGTCTDTELLLPGEYNGKPVTAIARNAFRDCAQLTTVVIPDNIVSIGAGAFSGCSNLQTIEFWGTIAQWQSIAQENVFGENARTVMVCCTDGNVFGA